MAKLIKIRPPGRNRCSITLPVEEFGDCIPLASLNDVPLERGHGAAVENPMSRFLTAHHQFNSRRHLFHHPEDGWAELIIPAAVNFQVNGLAVTSAC